MQNRFRTSLRARFKRSATPSVAHAKRLALPRAFHPGPSRAALLCALGLVCITALPKVPGWMNKDWQVAPQALMQDAMPMARLISEKDKATYTEIIRAQQKKDWTTMDALMAQLQNPILTSTLRAQRWLEGDAKPGQLEIQGWLQANATHPYLPQMQTLARALYPDHFAAGASDANENASLALRMRPGSLASESTMRYNDDARSMAALSPKERGTVQAALEQFQQRLSDDHRTQGLEGMDRATRGLSALGQDMLRWQEANILFSYGDMASALRYAAPAADRSGDVQPAMHWVAGMAAWQQELYMRARHHFHHMAQGAKKLPSGDAAAAHFWAARAWDMTGHHPEGTIMRQHAAAYGESFYAQLARQQLQQPAARSSTSLQQHTRLMARGYLDHVWAMRHPGAVRAIVWQQLGQKSLAQWELAHVFESAPDEDRAILAHLAGVMNLPGLQLAMARQLPKPYGRLSSYPIPSWKPQTGFEVEQPLLLGIARQESGFDLSATSPTGASGLMQLMPQTAHYVARMQKPAAGGGQTPMQAAGDLGLSDPVTSLTLGQSYLKYLSEKTYVDRNLVLLIAAYNAGPKATIGWSAKLENGASDPLAFIETLSYSETRGYVQHVLANSWTYHQLLGTPADSLKLLAKSDWPLLGGGRSWFAYRAEKNPALLANVPVPTSKPSVLASK